MKLSLRKTPSHLHLAYKYGQASDNLTGRNFMLAVEGHELTLTMDLAPNFHTRNKTSPAYLEATGLAQNHHRLKFLQCSDNLVRARMIKAWDQVQQPRLTLCLDLGERGQFAFSVIPHSLFIGGIQFDVLQVLDGQADAGTQRGHGPHRQIPGIHS